MAKVNLISNTFQISISDISKLTMVWSPEFYVHDVPWKVKMQKFDNQTKSLGYYLHCGEEEASVDFSCAAACSVKLLPFNDNHGVIERFSQPFVFDGPGFGCGYSNFIQWDRLFNDKNQYVRDDTIQLEIKIEAEDPHKVDRSVMHFECVDKSCNSGCQATFRLTVKNIANLLAVRTPEFNLRDIPFYLTVYKDYRSNLGVYLRKVKRLDNAREMIVTVKILSSNEQIAKTQSNCQFKDAEFSYVRDIITWQELMNPENGFFNNDSITIEVGIETGKQNGGALNGAVGDSKKEKKHLELECAICLEDFDTQDISSTPCGHLFCTECITKYIKDRKMCPTCKKITKLNALLRMYLPM